jgi:hypothetical protein
MHTAFANTFLPVGQHVILLYSAIQQFTEAPYYNVVKFECLPLELNARRLHGISLFT